MKASVVSFFFFEAGNRSMFAFKLEYLSGGERNYKIDIYIPPLRHNHSLHVCNPCMTVP